LVRVSGLAGAVLCTALAAMAVAGLLIFGGAPYIVILGVSIAMLCINLVALMRAHDKGRPGSN
jgi:hypothetical protein